MHTNFTLRTFIFNVRTQFSYVYRFYTINLHYEMHADAKIYNLFALKIVETFLETSKNRFKCNNDNDDGAMMIARKKITIYRRCWMMVITLNLIEIECNYYNLDLNLLNL